MRIRFHGHACFELRSPDSPTLLIDPYKPDGLGGRFNLPPIPAAPDIVAITHFHEDHAWIDSSWAHAAIVDGNCEAHGITFDTEPLYHDKVNGTQMGLSIALRFEYDDLDCLHLGDIGTMPTEAQIAKLSGADLLLIPVGGTYTLDPQEAVEAALALNPGWIIPMHGADPRIELPLRPVSEFCDAWPGAVFKDGFPRSWAELDERPPQPTVLNLVPS